MSRVLINRLGQAAIDLGALALAFWLAFLVRFDGELPDWGFKRLVLLMPYVVSLEFVVLVVFGVRRFAWRYVGLNEAVRIAMAVGTSLAILLVIRIVTGWLVPEVPWLRVTLIPTGVLIINAGLASLGVLGARALRRITVERSEAARHRPGERGTPIFLIGAGQAGAIVARELASRRDLGFQPVGFVDDDLLKQGAVIHGLKVLGTTDSLKELCTKHEVSQVLITIANAPSTVIRRLAQQCEEGGIAVKIIPGIYEIVGGQVNLSRIRSIAIEDLLGRAQVVLDLEAISAQIAGSRVLVSGAGGSIGSELCRQVCRFRPDRLVLLERSENALFEVHRELTASFPDLDVVPVIADICDQPRIDEVLDAHRPKLVFHAAAHKHVPMMEWNPGEAVKNNVFGTRTLARASVTAGVETFVQISTDKAVHPTSVMGATKRLAEMYLQALAKEGQTRFVTVRFGNVLGSAGSVVPIFRKQIAAGGPVQVTHPDMRRYFMLTAEACQLVLQAASFAEGGEIFVLDMGEPVRIVDLAKDMIRLSGYEPDVDIKIEFIGVRPGEKLFEELLSDGEEHDRTVHPKILVGRAGAVTPAYAEQVLAELRSVMVGPPDEVFPTLAAIVTQLDAKVAGAERASSPLASLRPSMSSEG
ncbi:MAG: polysaccharide biosynthesis protein [Polyangiaceae bacterium]|nr:polysaccharide biosynthesis protein [Polyangiaceae bacterium]MCW5791030.1 polysaccharide biosynthesis protein [Polyangiaceae bacterium]